MKINTRHKKALDRLVQESVNILSLSRGPAKVDLKLKSQWGQAQVLRVSITMPNQVRPGGNPEEDKQPAVQGVHFGYGCGRKTRE